MKVELNRNGQIEKINRNKLKNSSHVFMMD